MDKEEILKNNAELKDYIENYLNAEYNASENTRKSYAYDLLVLANFYNGKNITYLKK